MGQRNSKAQGQSKELEMLAEMTEAEMTEELTESELNAHNSITKSSEEGSVEPVSAQIEANLT